MDIFYATNFGSLNNKEKYDVLSVMALAVNLNTGNLE